MHHVVAHVEKYKTNARADGIQKHEERSFRNSRNKEIDPALSKNNFDALDLDLSGKKYSQRIGEIMDNQCPGWNTKGSKNFVRKDAPKMVSWLISSDHEFFENMNRDEVKKFFRVAADFLSDRYGRENVVSCPVHLDERTPHMTFNFVPRCQKSGKYAVSKVINRAELLSMQKELPTYLQEHGYNLDRGMEGSAARHVDPVAFKEKIAVDQRENLQKEISVLKMATQNLKAERTVLGDERFGPTMAQLREHVHYATKLGGMVTDKENVIMPKSVWDAAWKIGCSAEKNYQEKIAASISHKSIDDAISKVENVHLNSKMKNASIVAHGMGAGAAKQKIKQLEQRIAIAENLVPGLQKSILGVEKAAARVNMPAAKYASLVAKLGEKDAATFALENSAKNRLDREAEADYLAQ